MRRGRGRLRCSGHDTGPLTSRVGREGVSVNTVQGQRRGRQRRGTINLWVFCVIFHVAYLFSFVSVYFIAMFI